MVESNVLFINTFLAPTKYPYNKLASLTKGRAAGKTVPSLKI